MTENYFYPDITKKDVELQYLENKKCIRSTYICLLISFSLCFYIIGASFYLVNMAISPPRYDAVASNWINFYQRIFPYRNPDVTDRQAIYWAKERACQLLSLHFKKYRDQIARRSDLFLEDGWTLYQKSLIEHGVIEKITEEGLILTAVNYDAPRLLHKYMINGRVNWGLEVPVLQTIQGASSKSFTNRKIVLITVEEADRVESLSGLKIRAFDVKK